MNPASGIDLWSSVAWQASAVAWVDEHLRARGIIRTGDDPAPRIRTWSAVFRFPTDHGDVWFKAASPVTAYEMALYPILADVMPEEILVPLTVDPGRAWLLLPDGGTSLMHAAPRERLVDHLTPIIAHYARLQISLMPLASAMVEAGVPDMRPARMPDRFDEAFAAIGDLTRRFPEPGDAALLERVAAFRPGYIALCNELSASPIPPTLDHGDLHSNNILADVGGSPRIYDWGDSAVAHPFATMLEFRRFTAEALALPQTSPEIEHLCDVYLAEFAVFGSESERRQAMDTAQRVAMVSRALTYINVMSLGPLPDPSWNREAVRWMERLLAD